MNDTQYLTWFAENGFSFHLNDGKATLEFFDKTGLVKTVSVPHTWNDNETESLKKVIDAAIPIS